jgi:AraC-like DNA-binding protein
MQEQPAKAWTVARLGTETGLSRAAFARRFTELVGEPPMAYLTSWRMSLAADLLTEPEATVAAVARQVGYGTPFAFSTAFKRAHRVSPQHFRAGVPG